MKTLVGLIPDNEHVATTVQAIKEAGIDEYQVSAPVHPATIWEAIGGHSKKRTLLKFAVYGGLLGLLVATLYGLPASILNCIHMQCPFADNLGLLLAITAFWIAAGAFLGAIVGLDRFERDLYVFTESIHRGASLMFVEAPDEQTSEVSQILQAEGGLMMGVYTGATK